MLGLKDCLTKAQQNHQYHLLTNFKKPTVDDKTFSQLLHDFIWSITWVNLCLKKP